MEHNWRQKSIEHLEKRTYGDPDEAPTGLIRKCLQLTKIPVGDFTVENLRMMIGQGFALSYLVPLALEQLKKNRYAAGDFYEGDLLKSLQGIDDDFWEKHKGLSVQFKKRTAHR
jgi:hypothetical protein